MPKQKYQFPIDYPGTKFQESQKTLKADDYAQYNHIIEPYGGTFGFCRWLYSENPDHPRTFTVCDNNEKLINQYNSWKAMTRDEFCEYIKEYQDLIEALPSTGTGSKRLIDRVDMNDTIKNNPKFDMMFYYNYGRFTYKRTKEPELCAFWWDMFQKTTFICQSSNDLLKFDEPETLIYIDPPYLLQCNENYSNVNTDYSKIIYDSFNGFKHAHGMFVHSEHFLITLAFGKWLFKSYIKKYGMSKRVLNHHVFKSN